MRWKGPVISVAFAVTLATTASANANSTKQKWKHSWLQRQESSSSENFQKNPLETFGTDSKLGFLLDLSFIASALQILKKVSRFALPSYPSVLCQLKP